MDFISAHLLTISFIVVVILVVIILSLRIGTGRAGLGGAQPAVYVANMNNNTITVYNIDPNAPDDSQVATSPSVTYRGYELSAPQEISLDPSGRACVANLGAGENSAPSIALYNVDFSSGAIQLQGTITGGTTELEIPRGLAWWLKSGNVVVSNSTEAELTGRAPGILEFAATAGNQAPVGRVQGQDTAILMPWRVGVDSDDRIYVPDPFTDALLIWASRPNTAITRAPDWRIAGANPNLHRPVSVAIDRDGITYVLNAGVEAYQPADGGAAVAAQPAAITAYPAIAAQPAGVLDIAPLWTFVPDGPARLVAAAAIAVDDRGLLYVSDIVSSDPLGTGPGSAAQESGKLVIMSLTPNQPPNTLQVIEGAGTGLYGPGGIAVI